MEVVFLLSGVTSVEAKRVDVYVSMWVKASRKNERSIT